MFTEDPRVSLADLAAAGVRLLPADAVTIARELILQVARGDVPGVPSAHVIRLSRGGTIAVEGPVAAGGRAVSRAAQLLEALLPPKDAGPEYRTPGALRLCVVRGLGMLDVPPYPSLDSFADALQRFAATDPAATIRTIVERYEAATAIPPVPPLPLPVEPVPSAPLPVAPAAEVVPEPPRREVVPEPSRRIEAKHAPQQALARLGPETLTISDLRRARRATGLPLAEISSRSRIPVGLLRQLEWGYLVNWPGGLYGRTQLVRYARAAGLDEQIVISTVWPMLDEVEREAPREEVAAPVAAVQAASPARVDTTVVAAADLPLVPQTSDLALDIERPERGDVALFESARPRTPSHRGRIAAMAVAAAILLFLLVPQLVNGPGFWRGSGADQGAPLESVSSAPASPAPISDSPAPASDRRDQVVADATEPATPPQHDGAVSTAGAQPPVAPAKSTPVDDVRPAEASPASGLTDAENSWSPSFASVGTAMFYHVDGEQGSALMRAAGEGTTLRITRIIDDNARNYHARPSPDASQIAFDSDRDGERGVYIANADGTNVRRVSGEGFAAVPSWSPDGQTLVFVRAEPRRPAVWNLWRLDLASGQMERLTSHRYGQMWGGSWFPDSRHIAYSHELRLVVLDTQTGRERSYQSPRKGKLVRTPAVSPDGKRIIFQVRHDGAWLLDVEDGAMRKVLADPTAEEYSWSPDGRRVAYHSRRSGDWGVWLMSAGH
jgi:cytoskeletal protein RodZ